MLSPEEHQTLELLSDVKTFLEDSSLDRKGRMLLDRVITAVDELLDLDELDEDEDEDFDLVRNTIDLFPEELEPDDEDDDLDLEGDEDDDLDDLEDEEGEEGEEDDEDDDEDDDLEDEEDEEE